ncbi:hypothetical protein AMJ47_00605 [Parcubacteria bacterium DG_72]|nr:MAG: hypothetical protein AMJ47_00605 [Parcubacteria bacterium DG_72]
MKKKIILIIVAIIIVILIIGLGIFVLVKLFAEKCDPLTPLALQSFERAAGIRPVEGEKCQVSKNNYLLKIVYEDKDTALLAKNGLQLATEGERKDIQGLDWVTNDKDSSVFWVFRKTVAILVLPGEDDKDDVEKQLDKAQKLLK